MIDIKKRLSQVRQLMQKEQIDMYLVPSIDAHCSEYVPECFNRRPWISGFTGSAGEALITMDHAYLATDGRYFLQAEDELDSSEYTLLKQTGAVSVIETWLTDNGKNLALGVDPSVVSIKRSEKLQTILENQQGGLKFIDKNLIDECRLANNDKLELPQEKVFILDDKYAGFSITNKLSWLQGVMQDQSADYLVLNLLDDIAWLFNLRGSDIDYNPLFISYVIIGKEKILLFIDLNKIDNDVKQHLASNKIHVLSYQEFGDTLKTLGGSIWLDGKTASSFIYSKINHDNQIILEPSPIIHKKACKNEIEVKGSKQAHIKDAVSLCNFFAWLENNWQQGVNEISCADRLYEFRSKQENFIGNSFNTISSFGSNGAIIHYAVSEKTNKKVDDSSLYLLDSGGQYLEGTTDVTRMIHLGEPTAQQKRHYTLVLKGHLALARCKFPHGTCGESLDALARQYLWEDHLNYLHGTGHGVGSFLCVHEGPQRISTAASNIPLLPGMIVSNEPGLYLANQYGIRIENLCVVQKCNTEGAQNSEYGPFYSFDNLTLVPYSKNLIDKDLLVDIEIEQVKNYYGQIRQKVLPLVAGETRTWLLEELKLF